jgi:hypothetical protein
MFVGESNNSVAARLMETVGETQTGTQNGKQNSELLV